jgi:2-oxoisovalerate dehydrogenase E2 component (dihydrolipoyl transacylase)
MPTLDMPNVGEGVKEGVVVKWLKQEGDPVERDEPVVEVETDKALVEIPCPLEGRLTKILVQEDETVAIGDPIAEFEAVEAAAGAAHGVPKPEEPAVAAAPAVAQPSTNGAEASGPSRAPTRTGRYSPVVLKLAAEHGVALESVEGTGVGGRVTRKDVLRHIEQSDGGVPTPARAAQPATPEPSPVVAEAARPVVEGKVEVVKLTPTRRSIARHMDESNRTIPSVWMVVEADVTSLVALRERHKEEFQRTEGVNLTYFPLFVQAIVAALKQNPMLNASYADGGVHIHHRYDVGIAVAAESGLVVPVVREADRKSVAGLAREIEELSRKARERRLTVQEMQGATFTIDNTGAFGSVISKPLIPVGQVAIITTELVRRELRVNADGSFGGRSVMNLCVSFDHRALDGAEAGTFMRAVKDNLEAYRPDQPLY